MRQNQQCEQPQRAVRKHSGGRQLQQVTRMIDFDVQVAVIVNQLRQTGGDRLERRLVHGPGTPRRAVQAAQGSRQVAAVGCQARRGGQSIRPPHRRRLQLQELPGLHLPAGGQRGGTDRRRGRRQHGARQVGGAPPHRAAAAAILMLQHHTVFAAPFGRDEVLRGAPAAYRGSAPVPCAVRKQELVRRLALDHVHQFLLDDGEGAASQLVAQFAVGELQRVAQERVARPGALSKIVHRPAGHHHIGHQRHAIGRPAAGAVKQVTHMRGAAVRAAHRGGGFAERAPSHRAQEPDCVEQVRLAGAIGTDDTGKGAEPDIGVDQIPEPGNPQSSQHGRLPTGCDAARAVPCRARRR